MFSVERRGAPGPRGDNRPSRNQDFKHPRRLRSLHRHPVRTSTWPPDGFDSGYHSLHRRPMYVSFVSKAILWDRGVCHSAVHDRPVHRPAMCPRFLSHMKVHPEEFHPPCFLTSTHQFLSQGKIQSVQYLPAPKTQNLEHLNHDARLDGEQEVGLTEGRCSADVSFSLQFPATPPSSSLNSSPHQLNTPRLDSGRQESGSNTIRTIEILPLPPIVPPLPEKNEVPERVKVVQPALVEPEGDLSLRPSGSRPSASPTSLSVGSLSDLSRPPSSLFSRSTDLLSGRSSILSTNTAADAVDSDCQGSVCFSSRQLSPVALAPLASWTPTESLKFKTSTSTPSLKSFSDLLKPRSPRPTPAIQPHADEPQRSRRSSKAAKSLNLNTSTDPDLSLSQSPGRGHAPLSLPSPTPTLSPHRTSAPSGLGANLTPSPPPPRLQSHRWPVLPSISPVIGGSAASHCSEISCSQSHMFDELEAIAPPSTSCLSLDQESDSSASTSPETELSPGLAALTVACDSGNLGSLSRVQLLLLDRPVLETPLSPSDLEEAFSPVQEWSDLMTSDDPELTSTVLSGHLRPLTAGSISERCDSAGQVQENKSDWSEGDFGTPFSWIIDPSPSHDMLRSSGSPCPSNHSTHTRHERSPEEEPSHPERSDQVLQSDGEETPKSVRKAKALNMLSKLQDNLPRQRKSSKSCSNFEDFDFLAKYCIFSQEKLAEYKRAFEAEDTDGDGYISSLQVLLALKTITPPELLSDEEEIYVYRILEMVDFRVTDGLVDLRLFAVIASLAQKIASMDEFMRSLISSMDFRSLEVRLFKAKEQREESGAEQGFISGEQLLLELKAGGIHLEQEAAIRLELQHVPPLDLLDFLAYLPLFMLIHKSVISNPLDDSSRL